MSIGFLYLFFFVIIPVFRLLFLYNIHNTALQTGEGIPVLSLQNFPDMCYYNAKTAPVKGDVSTIILITESVTPTTALPVS